MIAVQHAVLLKVLVKLCADAGVTARCTLSNVAQMPAVHTCQQR